jgi:hypothetical protein
MVNKLALMGASTGNSHPSDWLVPIDLLHQHSVEPSVENVDRQPTRVDGAPNSSAAKLRGWR